MSLEDAINNLSLSFQSVAQAMQTRNEIEMAKFTTTEIVGSKAEEKPQPKPRAKKAKAEVAEQESVVTVDEVRAVMSEIKDTSKAMDILKKHGGGKLTEVPVEKLADLFADAHAVLVAEANAEEAEDDA